MSLQKWKLLSSVNISPSHWFPLEKRAYQLPNGNVVEDFYVTTLADSVHVVALTKDKKVVMVRMYKQGIDDIMIQFPAGRFEVDKHADFQQAATMELEEEAGIHVAQTELMFVGKLAVMTTKATECVQLFLVKDVEFNSIPHWDENEEIEVLTLTPEEIDEHIRVGTIYDADAIAIWSLIKLKYPQLFS